MKSQRGAGQGCLLDGEATHGQGVLSSAATRHYWLWPSVRGQSTTE